MVLWPFAKYLRTLAWSSPGNASRKAACAGLALPRACDGLAQAPRSPDSRTIYDHVESTDHQTSGMGQLRHSGVTARGGATRRGHSGGASLVGGFGLVNLEREIGGEVELGRYQAGRRSLETSHELLACEPPTLFAPGSLREVPPTFTFDAVCRLLELPPTPGARDVVPSGSGPPAPAPPNPDCPPPSSRVQAPMPSAGNNATSPLPQISFSTCRRPS